MVGKRNEAQLLLQAAKRERKLIASELHDTVCQSLAALSLCTSAAVRRGRGGKRILVSELVAIEHRLGQVLDQCRSFMAFDVLEAQPNLLSVKIAEYIKLFDGRINCQVDIDPRLSLPSGKIASFYYQLIREAVLAGARVPAAPKLEIILVQTTSHHFLKITGVGFGSKTWKVLLTQPAIPALFCKALGGVWKMEKSVIQCRFKNELQRMT